MALNNGPLPDYGAGLWHRHKAGEYGMIHIWFDRPIENAFGGF